MSELKVVTNNKPRKLVCVVDLPDEAANDFKEYIEDWFQPRIVQYKGCYYDAYDSQAIKAATGLPMGWAMVVDPSHPFANWHAIVSETFFSGILFRFVEYDEVVCGSYYS